MKASGKSIIRDIMEQKGITHTALAKKLGISRPLLSMRILKNKGVYDISASILAETLSALDYKLIAIPSSSTLPQTAYEIETAPITTPKVNSKHE